MTRKPPQKHLAPRWYWRQQSHVATEKTYGVMDTGYIGIKKLQKNSRLPKKSSKKKPLTKEYKKQNRAISSERVVNENVIGSLKRFKIVNDKYRNRRKRFGLRFNLIAGIYNFELPS